MNHFERKFSRRQLLKSSAVVAGSLTLPWPTLSQQRPDILFVSIDDLREWPQPFGKLAAHVAPNILGLCKTARLYQMAQSDAVRTRSSVLTGLPPDRCDGNLGDSAVRAQAAKEQGLARVTTLPRFLLEKGDYHVAGGGKVFASGFGAGKCNAHYDESSWSNWFHTDFALQGHADDESLTEFAVHELQSARKPTFLALGFFRPHHDLFIPQKYFAYSQSGFDNEYLASIAYADSCLGRLLKASRSRKTLVVLWTHTKHRTHAPLLVSAPGLKPEQIETLVRPTQIFPTLVELAGLQKPDDRNAQWSDQSLISGFRV